ncbi:docking protein 5 [Triplophysa rosa]|uniref:Docking protein 2 n=1 Tax=Triplophysa rosa TaxID=992332 RepID=A0A9W7TAJ6_TRIRA|nr:docking protein 5 [Triplophysa rosa]KAI7793241.1 putative docking protein 2 [Triplophysa rosa]
MEEDIRRNGKLYLHQKRFGKRWRKVWCVLVAEGRRSVARLELYEHKHMSVKEGSSRRKPDYKQVIRLRECIRISEKEMDDCPKDCATFLLETTDKLYVFAAHQPEAEEWIKCLCEQAFPDTQIEQRLQRQSGNLSEPVSGYREMQENSLYDTADSVREFVVIAVGTEAAVRCNLYGKYILTAQPACLLLKDSNTKKVLLKWPYCYVRKFGQDTLSFSFEAGRRCESGEGNFEFATHQGEQIFCIVSEAIQHLPKTSAAKQSGSTHEVQSTEITDRIYDDINPSDRSCPSQQLVQHPSKKLSASTRSLSLNAIQSLCQVTSIKTNSENEEPVYAIVSKAQPKSTSPTDPHTHWQNLRKAIHQFEPPQDSCTADTDISQSAFVTPREDGEYDETVTGQDSTDLLSDSIHQLAINDALKNISAEAIYADPQDLEPIAESDVDAVYDDPEEVIKSNQRAQDGVDHSAECDFFYIPDTLSTHVMAARSSPSQSLDDISSEYDNLMLKGRRM